MTNPRRWWWRLRAVLRSIGARCVVCGGSLSFQKWFGVEGGKACRPCVLVILGSVTAEQRAARRQVRIPVDVGGLRGLFGVKLVHYAIVPFQAVCGADVPNQSTSAVLARVSCPACMDESKRNG